MWFVGVHMRNYSFRLCTKIMRGGFIPPEPPLFPMPLQDVMSLLINNIVPEEKLVADLFL